jgi:hypothetical protein
MLRTDPDFGLYADLEALPAYRPARTVTPEEAGKLLARGIANRRLKGAFDSRISVPGLQMTKEQLAALLGSDRLRRGLLR